jgi:hypothetical protein
LYLTISEAYYFTYYNEEFPDYIESNRVKVSNSIDFLLEYYMKRPLDFYIFNDSFKWTIIISHEYLNDEGTHKYLLINK